MLLLASSLGRIVHPLFILLATLLAWFYTLIPNYAVAIALLTIAVMIVVFPITRRGTRSMMKMQLLAPELKKVQARFKAQPNMTVAEKQESRTRLNEEMMALYKENGVSPTGGCLPMFLQFPIFIILYDTIKGLIHTVNVHGHVVPRPLYVNPSSKLYHTVIHANGQLKAFGLNLSDSVRTSGLSWGSKAPLLALILVAIALQYIQMKQLSGRNPAAAAANPQMQQMQKVFPIIFAVIYIAIPAGVNVYFIVSSLFRISQQEFMYRNDPQIQESVAKLNSRMKSEDPKVVEAKLALRQQARANRRGVFPRLNPALSASADGDAGSNGNGSGNGTESQNGSNRSSRARRSGTNNRSSAGAARKGQPRPQGKRPRKPR